MLYAAVLSIRNGLYDRKFLASKKFSLPVIAVGNLSLGGTGKSPMIEFLMDRLHSRYRLAVISRGYKRKTKGFVLLDGTESASVAGDEPLQFKCKFPGEIVAVDENRDDGISRVLELEPPPEVILLDDAFQHRRVQAGLYILLTRYDSLFSEDHVLPAGNLREPRSGARRADIIVVSKCPQDLPQAEKRRIIGKIQMRRDQEVFFSFVTYGKIQSGNGSFALQELRGKHFWLVTGIADPSPLVDFLTDQGLSFTHLKFGDHHNFTDSEIKGLNQKDLILTTEKDYMRLRRSLSVEKLCYLPITVSIDREAEFLAAVEFFIKKNETG